MLAQIRKPHRSVGRAHRIAAGAHPLPHYLVRRRVDFGQGTLRDGGPDAAFAECQLAAGSVMKPLDAVTLAGVSLLLAAVALLASYIPARRAANADLMDSLPCE